ncbi:MAG TPA: GH32 C-terminal domain-containing protein [Verrucomicrobiota bacterium]|nr:GH32 C-terminal domain-containing protein [Verrucomicrobiota bacterium]HNU53321.1 GH32 C-terminal domain-containing protein [Verrucomicrobiota bacterium]
MKRHTPSIFGVTELCGLMLVAAAPCRPAASGPEELRDKTLVAWVSPANLIQKGGSVLTLEKPGGVFDAMVFGELAPATWMAGSDGFRRTKQEQRDFPKETGPQAAPVQVAMVYSGRQITLYREGQQAATYTAGNAAERFGSDAWVLLGLRHLDAAPENRFFAGSIDDARVYGVALDAAQIAALKPNQASEPSPLAWWDFENGVASDRMGAFPATTLFHRARLEGGRLHLDRPGAFMLASRETLESRQGSGSGGGVDRSARALREKLLSDPHRPGYHFVTPEGTCMPFDPNGAVYWKGRYHLFYIFQDQRGHNWGHVSSTDLFHWRHHPTGLVSGMFSGNGFINHEGRPTMCYHQVGQGNAMAVALDDELNAWKKLDSNPITPRTEPGDPHHGKYRSWDPYGWFEDGTYYAIFGGERPAVAKAPSLAGEWRYVGDLMANSVPGVAINEDVSCADFFTLGGRRVLLCISHRLGCRYYVGDWKGEHFHPAFHAPMSWTDHSFFAPESLLDDRGRRIMWAWIFDLPQFAMRTDFGWSGTMSLPRVLSLAGDGRLRMNPPGEIERLRYNARRQTDVMIEADSELVLGEIQGNSLELRVVFRAPDARQCGVKVCCSPDGEEQTPVYYDAAERRLAVDTTRSSRGEGPRTLEAGPFELEAGEPLELRVFVDKSVVEVFANDGRQAVMRRLYPSRADSLGVRLFSVGGPASVPLIEAWDMMPANPF